MATLGEAVDKYPRLALPPVALARSVLAKPEQFSGTSLKSGHLLSHPSQQQTDIHGLHFIMSQDEVKAGSMPRSTHQSACQA